MISVEFRQSVERLAASAQDQGAYLQRLGTAPSADELALEFSEALAVERPRLDPSARDAAVALDEYLTAISGPERAGLWTVAALSESPEWARVRRLAAEILQCIDEPRGAT